MELKQRIIDNSKDLTNLLMTDNTFEDRENLLNEITRLIDDRDWLLKAAFENNLFSNIEEDVKKTLVKEDIDIKENLDKIMETIKSDLKMVNLKRKSEDPYTNPYSNFVTIDGRYYDKKK